MFARHTLQALALALALTASSSATLAITDLRQKTVLHGSVSEEQMLEATDTLSGHVEHTVETEPYDVISGNVIVTKNPNNHFPQHIDVIAGRVVEPYNPQDTMNAINTGLSIFGGASSIMNWGSGYSGGHTHSHPIYTPSPIYTPAPHPHPVYTPTPHSHPVYTPAPHPVYTPAPHPSPGSYSGGFHSHHPGRYR